MFFKNRKNVARSPRQVSRRYVRALAAVHHSIFESLEPRVLLSCVVTQVGSTLSIVGNADSDFVQVVDMGAGSVSVGCSTSPGPVQSKTYSNVAHIKIDTGAGDDTVTLVGQGGGGGAGALFDVFADVTLSTGAGADTVSATYLKIKGDPVLAASLGDGADSFQMDVSEVLATSSATVPTSSLHAVKLTLDGGAGNDTARCSLFDAFSTVSATMGAGNDSFDMKHRGELHLAADMGDGNDTFSASADGSFSNAAGTPPPFASSFFLKYSGGLGNDSAKLSFFDVFTDMSLDQGAGNDDTYMKIELSASNAFAPPAGMVTDCRVFLAGGDGNDTATLITNLAYMPTARACVFSLDMGAGNDTVQLDSTTTGTPSAQLQASSLYMKIDGGTGNDTARLSFFDVFTELSSDMGAGNDALYLKIDGITGESLVSSSLGAGDDTFSLTANSSADHKGFVAPVGTSPDALFLKIDGGDGNDSISTACTDVFFDSSVDGGAGSDLIFQKCALSDKMAGSAPLDMQADSSLRVLGGDGNDTVSIGLLVPAVQVAREVDVAADLGAGSDQFSCDASAATAAKVFPKIEIRVADGDGNDTTNMSFFDVFTEVAIDGGNGNDSAFLKYDGIRGDCAVAADMGAGNDVFDVSANSSVAHPGYTPPAALSLNFSKITFKYDGGAGNDTCRLALTDVVSDAALDGGDGNDTFVVRDTLTDKFETGQIPDQTDFTLQLSAGAGNDNVQLAVLTPTLATGHSMSLDVDLGAGSDVFSSNMASNGKGYDLMKAKMRVAGGDGNDSVKMSFFDVFTECSLDMGAGNDVAFLKYDGVKGDCAVSADMGAGSDSLTVDAASSAAHQGYVPPVGASPDSLFIKFDGGDGNDACNVSTSDVFSAQSLDGGAGNDTFVIKSQFSDLQIGDRPTSSQFASFIDGDVSCSISGGAGADVVHYTMKASPLLADRVVAVSADMGDGSDVFTMDATGDSSFASGKHIGKAELNCSAGAGNDSVTCTYTDIFADTSLDMGAGNDSVDHKHAGVQGESSFACDLGTGSDNLTSAVSASSTSPPAGVVAAPSAMFMKIDGGDGNDVVSATFFDVFSDFMADMGGGTNRVSVQDTFGNASRAAVRPPDMSSDTHIGVSCGDGSDNVLIALLMPAQATPRQASVDVDCGGGADVFQMTATGVPNPNAPTALAAKFHLKLDMGAGSDRAQVSCTDVFSDVSTTMGDGNDQYYLKYKGEIGESVSAVDMGAGSDIFDLSAQSTLSPTQSAAEASALFIKYDGLDGADTVRMSFFDVFCDVSADLGNGNDTFTIKQQLSVDAALPPDMASACALNVTGGDGNDSVLIGLLLPAVQTAPTSPAADVRVDLGNGNNTVQFTCDSSTPLATTSGGGLAVEVACGTGNNNVSVQVGSPQSPPAQLHDFGSVSLQVTCDGGNNTVSLATYASFAQGEVCDDGASTGDGADNITVSNTFGVCDGSVRVVVDSGAGADKVLALAIGDVNGDGSLDMIANGGAGDDSVMIRESPTKASLGRVSLEADGGDGNDTLTVVCPDGTTANGAASNLVALADGGPGYDVAYVSPAVQTLDVEEIHPPL